jgi:hypothetical protein
VTCPKCQHEFNYQYYALGFSSSSRKPLLVGLIGSLVGFSIIELIVANRFVSAANHLLNTIVVTGAFGICFGAVMGAAEGFFKKDLDRLYYGLKVSWEPKSNQIPPFSNQAQPQFQPEPSIDGAFLWYNHYLELSDNLSKNPRTAGCSFCYTQSTRRTSQNVLCFVPAASPGRGSVDALAVNIKVLYCPPTVRVRRAFCWADQIVAGLD